MNGKKLVLGTAAMLASAWLLSLVGDALGLGRWLSDTTLGSVGWLLSALAGGAVARRGFIPVAVLVWLAVWLVSVYILYQVALPVGQASVSAILAGNWLALATSLAAIVVGAALGQRLAAGGSSKLSVAT